MLGRLKSRKSYLDVPKRHVSTGTSSNTVAFPTTCTNNEATSQHRRSLLTRKSPAAGCSKKLLPKLMKQTINANNLKAFEKQVPRAPSVSTVKKGRFSTGSFTLNSTQTLDEKVDTEFKTDALSNENSLNATYCLPSSEATCMRHIPQKEDLDMMILHQNLPNIGISKGRPEQEQIESNVCPLPLVEPSNLTPLFTSFIAEECLHIAAELNEKRETYPLLTLGTANPIPVTGVSMISEEPMPLDSSVYSCCCSNTSPAKLALLCHSKLQENILEDMSSQQNLAEIKTGDLTVGTRMSNDYIETGALPWSPPENLIQFNETITQGNLNDEEDTALKHDVYSSYVLNESPLSSVEYIQLNVPKVTNDVSITCSDTKNDASSSFVPAKTQSNSNLSLSKGDLVLSERSLLSDEKQILPKHRSFENELEPPDLLGCTPSLSLSTDLIQLDDTVTVRDKNVTFVLSKDENSFRKGLQTSALSNFKQSMSPQDLLQLNVTMNVDDLKNTTCDTSKYKDLGNDLCCKLPVSMREEIQLNATMILNDHKNATFIASKHEGCLTNDILSNLEQSLTTTNQDELNRIITVSDCKDATFVAPKLKDGLANNPNKTTNLANCKLSLSSDSNEVRLTAKNLKLVRKAEALTSGSELEQVKMSGKNNHSSLSLNFGKGSYSTGTEKRSNEVKPGDDCISVELHKAACAVETSLPFIDSSQKKEQSICEHADSFHDLVSSEWAPNCISTPCLARKTTIPEYLQLDHSFLASSSTLQADVSDGLGKCPNDQDKTIDVAKSSGPEITEAKSSGRKTSNAPSQQLQQTKMGSENSLKRISYLPAAKKKNITEASVSELCKSGVQKDIVPSSAQTCKIGSSVKRGKPSIQPPAFSKLCLPKSRQLSGKLGRAVATGQMLGNNNKILPYHIKANTKMSPKIKSTPPLTKAISKIPGVKRTSSVVSSKLPVSKTQKSTELFNIGTADPPHAIRKASKPLVLDSQNVVTGIKRPNSAVEQKRRLYPSPKRSKTAGEVAIKQTKLKPLLGDSKQKMTRKSLTSESKVKMVKTATEASTFKSKQELEVAKLQKKNKELEDKIAMLERQNAALQQGKENLALVLEEGSIV
ncbi:uncharacterized protein LOC132820123 isoform X2 [Hemiscyllium ocellatum]|uniref:uncharacterized protein LOC132820123 isoform X2 n=1 Tax=Hemiscyllium ocellatum TaxID=170820 RepID=UPI0029675E5B|nr:uncharacterized protein LOC132820123 isoform X2 [Hemiscyllium ocellatum]